MNNQMSAMLNIDGSDDPFYRYKMPEVQVKVEGRGNGIKTVILNMDDIASSLKCESSYLTKFFGMELGTVSMWDNKRKISIVNGKHDKLVLHNIISDFIKRFILCPQCNLPETILKVKKSCLYAKCSACNFYGPSDNQHKLSSHILKHLQLVKNKEQKEEN